jgi:transposase
MWPRVVPQEEGHLMGSEAKKAAFDMHKAGDRREWIIFTINSKYGTSRTTIKKWLRRWDKKQQRKTKGDSLRHPPAVLESVEAKGWTE